MYEISSYYRPKIWVATSNVVVEDFASHYYGSAVANLKMELGEMGIELLDPEYIYITASETEDDDTVALRINVGVQRPGENTDWIEFRQLNERKEILRIQTESFDDVHIGLAEWMHENDYEADGNLRRVLHDGPGYIYDCPIRKSES